jgi:hypothetical protein
VSRGEKIDRVSYDFEGKSWASSQGFLLDFHYRSGQVIPYSGVFHAELGKRRKFLQILRGQATSLHIKTPNEGNKNSFGWQLVTSPSLSIGLEFA